eukprot:NODE_4238_length_820_cov_21.834055_g4080_i0.p3 GENE.NODE_4238_length_820_cov_21.834055_g4080_i0~~NODE_4238_length_820_cov_21.834055_g4080_i0.p3  ORF type:complete len:102 (-),score=3.63 NODE_4238_length_820_cov_21.834055_g4080_i0:273-578(-)
MGGGSRWGETVEVESEGTERADAEEVLAAEGHSQVECEAFVGFAGRCSIFAGLHWTGAASPSRGAVAFVRPLGAELGVFPPREADVGQWVQILQRESVLEH